jgi:hypothetical protein
MTNGITCRGVYCRFELVELGHSAAIAALWSLSVSQDERIW